MCVIWILEENLLFSTSILGSVFSDYVAFYGDTVFSWKRSTSCAQAVYFLHSTMPSVTCLRLSHVTVICRVTYFQFAIQFVFFIIGRQASQQRTCFMKSYCTHVVFSEDTEVECLKLIKVLNKHENIKSSCVTVRSS